MKHVIQIYGKEFSLYNVHALVHLAADAKMFDSLNSLNCFPFENYLCIIKNILRKFNYFDIYCRNKHYFNPTQIYLYYMSLIAILGMTLGIKRI